LLFSLLLVFLWKSYLQLCFVQILLE